jgi:hypothetical protein
MIRQPNSTAKKNKVRNRNGGGRTDIFSAIFILPMNSDQ